MKNQLNEDIFSSSSSSSSSSSPSSSSSSKDAATINVKKKDMNDPTLQKSISSMKGAQVNVIDETSGEGPVKLEYLSDIHDKDTGDISQPFTINGKNYQMCRAINPKKEKVLGVYSIDESGDDNHVIYEVDYFENNIVSGTLPQEKPSTDAPTPVTQDDGPMEAKEMESPSFAGFKHFIVNRKAGKSKKIKNLADLAKAQMTEDEEYMGVNEFKKWIDEKLFGAKKKMMQEDTPTDPTIIASAQKLMDMISQKISPQVIQNIQKNTIAQREVIIAFAKMIGVPNNELNKIINGIRNVTTKGPSTTQNDASTSVSTTTTTPVAESKIIKKKDLK